MKLLRKKQSPASDYRHANIVGRTNAYSYHARRSQEPAALGRKLFRDAVNVNAQAAKQATNYWLQRFGMLLILIAVGVSFVNAIELSSDPKILPVDASQATFLRDTQTYQQAARKLFAGSFFNNNKITVNTGDITKQLQREFPELAVVSINLPLLGHRPIIYIESTLPEAVLTTAQGAMYIIDENGRAVSTASLTTAASLHLVPLTDASGTPVRVGGLALSSSAAVFIRTVAYQLQQKDVHVTTMSLPAGKSELDVYLSGQHYFIKFNLQNSASALQQVGTYLAVRHALAGRGVTPSQYIDVRLDGRAYYK